MKVGVILPIAQDRDTGVTRGWAALRDLALQADRSGLDSVWVFDHLIFRFPDRPPSGIWECWTMLAALAAVTERVELGTLVLATPFRNPAVLAKMADTVEEVSGGRLILGLGTGWHEPEFEAFGVPRDHRYSRFEDAFTIISRLLSDGHVDHDGRFHSAKDARLIPRGPRSGGPPILVAARGPRMLRLAARDADAWNAAWFGRPTRFLEQRAQLLDACRDVGRDPRTLRITAGVRVADPSSDGGEPLDPEAVLDGSSVRSITDGLSAYAQLGVDHVLCSLEPATPDSVGRLSEAAAALSASRSA
jgi:alkanesulfonate monooxygenase SsuD/methylene tetrahydromethanopterin reductase-like flavin-dependent oxidoreductase (luciferase family)